MSFDSGEFRSYLAQRGRSKRAIDRCLRNVAQYADWLGRPPRSSTAPDLERFDAERDQSVKPYLWALAYYFEHVDEPALADLA